MPKRRLRRFQARDALALVFAAVSVAVLAAPAAGLKTAALAATGQDPRLPALVPGETHAVGMRDTPIGLVRLWEAPTTAGGLCTFLQVPDLSSAAAEPVANGGSVCELGRHRPQRVPIVTSLTWIPKADRFVVLVDGHVASGITRLELVSGATRTPLALERGYFLGSLASNADAQLQREGAPYALVGYNARGAEVTRFDLLELVARSTPPATRQLLSPTERSRTLASCYPVAQMPYVQNHQGTAGGWVTCDDGFSGTYYYYISLRNRAGSSLSSKDGYFGTTMSVNAPTVTCTGAYVHSFLYINVDGTGKSDSGPEYGLC